MIAPLALVAGLACAQFGGTSPPAVEDVPPPRPATSRVAAVTIYQGQALVTREVAVPAGPGPGPVELVVTPLPPAVVPGSLSTDGADGLRVLSTRFRARAVRPDNRAAIQAAEDEIRTLGRDARRLQREVDVLGEDQQYLGKLEGFTGATLKAQAERGAPDEAAIVKLSDFIMERRAGKARSEVDLRQQLEATNLALAAARTRLGALAGDAGRVERDAVIVVSRARPEAGTVRLAYLVDRAGWRPQYRLRAAAAGAAPVRLEYLAAVTQETGEPWADARIALSTARPALDAAPPELLPLTMAVAGGRDDGGPGDGRDDQSGRIRAELNKVVDLPFPVATPLGDVIRYVRQSTVGAAFPEGIPIYVAPQELQAVDKTLASPLAIDLKGLPLRTTLRLALQQLNLGYKVRDGLLAVLADTPDNFGPPDGSRGDEPGMTGGMAGMGGGMGGMGGMGMALEQAQAASPAQLNRAAAGGQAAELRVGDAASPDPTAPAAEAPPSVSFAPAGPVDLPSRPEPQLIEVGRADLPADVYAQAVPVLTPRVYRLARLTNAGDLTLLPGEATVYVGDEFVGRMHVPLVAPGEAFVAGLGVDPRLQVSRRLVAKTRAIQGGNQVFTYEFRLNLRNYRDDAVRVQLWDRIPVAAGEAVAVNGLKTSAELSRDASYQKAGRADNLLRWDLDLPARTVGDAPLALTYEFRLEYARDLPPPRFRSGGLGEAPIGGPAAGGMGGMGVFQSVSPRGMISGTGSMPVPVPVPVPAGP